MNRIPTAKSATAEVDGRVLWRCRRGMKELDVLLERYARNCLRGASAHERRLFAALLELPDPELAAYMFGHAAPADPRLARLAQRIGCGVFATETSI